MKTIRHTSIAVATITVVLLLSGCTKGIDKYGAKIRRMYDDQLTIDAVLPANAPSITQQYRRFTKDNINERRDEHLGIDITAIEGTPVIAPANGIVVTSLIEPMYGNTIIIEHGTDASGRRLRTIYKHLQTRQVVPGDKVVRGQKIGGLGRTGLLSSGILHLHFEVLREDNTRRLVAVDPSLFWADGVGNVTCFDRSKKWPDNPFRLVYPVVCKGN